MFTKDKDLPPLGYPKELATDAEEIYSRRECAAVQGVIINQKSGNWDSNPELLLCDHRQVI